MIKLRTAISEDGRAIGRSPTELLKSWLCIRFLLVALALIGAQSAMADETTCGPLATPYGPFDYRTASKEVLKLVEDHHFNRDVETLKKGISGTIGGELNYTLRVIPNHHRALNALINLQFKLKTDRPPGTSWKVPCYFDRAIRFQPNDGTVREIYGVYLMRLGNKNEAVRQLELAAQLGGEDGNLAYNLGLAYFDVGNFDKSVMYAKKAYDLGFTLPGLKAKLKKAGKWPEDQ